MYNHVLYWIIYAWDTVAIDVNWCVALVFQQGRFVESKIPVQILPKVNPLGGGKGSDSDDDEPAAKKKATPALVRSICLFILFKLQWILMS